MRHGLGVGTTVNTGSYYDGVDIQFAAEQVLYALTATNTGESNYANIARIVGAPDASNATDLGNAILNQSSEATLTYQAPVGVVSVATLIVYDRLTNVGGDNDAVSVWIRQQGGTFRLVNQRVGSFDALAAGREIPILTSDVVGGFEIMLVHDALGTLAASHSIDACGVIINSGDFSAEFSEDFS